MELAPLSELENSDVVPPVLVASLNRATSYSRLPGVSSTIPETRAAGGRKRSLKNQCSAILPKSAPEKSSFVKIDLQFPCESRSFVRRDDGVRGLAHNDHLLVRHHDHAGELREPQADVDVSLKMETSIF